LGHLVYIDKKMYVKWKMPNELAHLTNCSTCEKFPQ